MNQSLNIIPDNRPLTSLCVVEDPDKCPKGYVVVSKTFDQDSDADLWRESGFFGRKCARYLCLSKTEGIQNYVVQSLCIINEKDITPQHYKSIPRTSDSDQKAWRKKQLCYKFAQLSTSPSFITDIIVLGKMKKAPEGFILSGEINGMTLCYRLGNVSKPNPSVYPSLPYPYTPGNPANTNFSNFPSNGFGNANNAFQGNHNDNNRPLLPFRPAPKPPASSYATLSGYNGLEGVPFVLNPKYNFGLNSSKEIPVPKLKTKSQIDEEYCYEFRTEHET